MKAKARAHANIALIKYWGKKDEALALPNNSSLSLTLDAFYTETEVTFSEDYQEDSFYLDGIKDDSSLKKVSEFTDLFRHLKKTDLRVCVKSRNHVPTAAGLASSASAFAALGMALNEALELGLDKQELSTLVRKGSGSASRSLYGGLVEWKEGYDDQSSYAYKFAEADFDIGMIAVLVNQHEKKISSREGMKITVETSPFYKMWKNEADKDLVNIKEAILKKDIDEIGKIAEANALKMHATMMSASPSIIYFEEKTMTAIQCVQKLRELGFSAYFTMDAGPNVKIICKLSEADKIKEILLKEFKEEEIIISKPGVGAEII